MQPKNQLVTNPDPPSMPATSTLSYLTLHPSIYVTSNLNRPKLTICDFDPCLNFGQCLPITDRKSFFKFQCVCPDHYSGILCEKYSPPPQPESFLPKFYSSSNSPITTVNRFTTQSQPSSYHYEQSTLDFSPDLTTLTYPLFSNQVTKFFFYPLRVGLKHCSRHF